MYSCDRHNFCTATSQTIDNQPDTQTLKHNKQQTEDWHYLGQPCQSCQSLTTVPVLHNYDNYTHLTLPHNSHNSRNIHKTNYIATIETIRIEETTNRYRSTATHIYYQFYRTGYNCNSNSIQQPQQLKFITRDIYTYVYIYSSFYRTQQKHCHFFITRTTIETIQNIEHKPSHYQIPPPHYHCHSPNRTGYILCCNNGLTHITNLYVYRQLYLHIGRNDRRREICRRKNEKSHYTKTHVHILLHITNNNICILSTPTTHTQNTYIMQT